MYPPTLPGAVVPRSRPPWVPAGSCHLARLGPLACGMWCLWHLWLAVLHLAACTFPPRGWVSGRVRQFDVPSSCWHRASPSSPATGVVACTPCQVVWLVPLWVSGGAPPVRGALALWLRLAGVWVHTAGSPLGPGAAYIPRVAQRCNTVVRCPNYVLGPRWLLRIASGVLRGHCESDSWVELHVP